MCTHAHTQSPSLRGAVSKAEQLVNATEGKQISYPFSFKVAFYLPGLTVSRVPPPKVTFLLDAELTPWHTPWQILHTGVHSTNRTRIPRKMQRDSRCYPCPLTLTATRTPFWPCSLDHSTQEPSWNTHQVGKQSSAQAAR